MVDKFIESEPCNVDSSIEMKLFKVEASFDVKPNIVEAFVDVKPSLVGSVDLKPSLVGYGVSKLCDNEVDTAPYFFIDYTWKVDKQQRRALL